MTFLSKVPLFKKWFQKASIAALERENPELAAAMKKMTAFGEPKSPEQAQRMLNLLTPAERRAYMAAVGAGDRDARRRESPAPPPDGARRRRHARADEAGLRPPRCVGPQERQGREEEALAPGWAIARADLEHGVDERAHVVVGRAVVDDARAQADLAVDARRRDPDVALLLERLDEPARCARRASATPAGTWRNGTIESCGSPQRCSSSARRATAS